MYDNGSRRSMNLSHESETDTAIWVMRLFRIGIVFTFVLLVGRLYHLQIMQGEIYRASADDNRFRLTEAASATRCHVRSYGANSSPQPTTFRS